ncbi:UxaA family hydrolase [Salinibacillus xinjiangensis]|nr:UxaA family hydrolase [Salinibacillus xinjiangensis]
MEQETTAGEKNSLVIDARDNVGIALTDLKVGDMCLVSIGNKVVQVELRDDVAFGHKFALKTFAKDESVYKYGEEIGKTTSSVPIGSWIHTHNMYCDRGLKE